MQRLGVLVASIVLAVGVSHAEVLTLFSDKGFPATPALKDPIPAFSGDGQAVFDGTSTAIAPPEGLSSWRTSDPNNTYVGWGMSYASPQNLSRFNSGELRFWVNTNIDIQLQIINSSNVSVVQKKISQLGWSTSQVNQWVQIQVPLQGVDLSSIVNPVNFTALTGPAVFYVDNVRYVDTTTTPIFKVSLLNRGSHTPAGSIDFGSIDLTTTSGWVIAPQYLEIIVDAGFYPYGVQIYTDNTASDADPVFQPTATSGLPGSNPAGLINTTTPSTRVPLAWSVKADAAATIPLAADPNTTSDSNSFQWLIMEDKATPTIALENTAAFTNGDAYIVLKNNLGIHYVQDASGFGAEVTPNVVYFEANLANAISPNSYKTTTLRVEFYTP